ncbi:MAG TPA: ABC transporter permease [Gemmatimonadaceae bacterium]|nr:ABC transporter permease [Gemmatimonadaceae bacterium]
MERVRHDIRIALRGFRRSPSFTLTAVLILAIGIGMAVAMFDVFDAVVLRPLPVTNPDRVVELFTYKGDPNTDYYVLREDLRKVAAASKTMRDVAGVVHWGAPPAPMIDGDRPLVLNRTLVTGNFFDVLGTRPLLGRLVQPSDETPGAELVIVLSYGAWRKHFAADSAIVGKGLVEPFGRKRYRIIGVAQPGLEYPAAVDIWMPAWQPSENLSVLAVARLAPNATPRAAQSDFLTIMKSLSSDRQYDGAHVETFTHAVVGDVQPILVVFVAAVALLLIIACVNVGNLLLLRAASRARELSVRRALGATYGDIVRQLVVESGLLGVAGGVLGLATAAGLVRILLAYAPPQLPRADVISVAGMPILLATGVTLAAVLLFGVVPAMLASRGDLASPLRYDARAGTETRARRRMRQALVASQVALALVMLAGAALLGRSLDRLQSISLGYKPEGLSLLSIAFPPSTYMDSAGKVDQARLNELGDQLAPVYRGLPGVTSVTQMLVPPFFGTGIFVGRLDLPGQTPEETKTNPVFPMEAGGADYFRTYGIPIRRGRAFTEGDDDKAEKVAVVSESAAQRIWPNADPIGKRIHFWSADSTELRTVVGVAGDMHYRALRESTAEVYLPWKQSYWQGAFAIRTSAPLASLLPALRRATTQVNPDLTLWQADEMADLIAKPLAQPRMSAVLLAGFAFVSLLLAAIGLYGVMASSVRASMRELGVRAALGASPERLRRGVLSQALTVTGVGAVVGLAVALASSRLLSKLLFEVSPADPVSMVGSAVLLVVVALIAAYLPARHATRVDPVAALRSD